jgi:DNA polymerase III alpha subunit
MSFLRQDLTKKRIVTCAEAMAERDGRWLWTAGLVLVRQRPGSAKGVMFLTLEDETGIVNAVVWPSLFERQRRVLMTASMMGIHGKIQREGGTAGSCRKDWCPSRASRRQPNSCEGCMPRRCAIAETLAPGSIASATA